MANLYDYITQQGVVVPDAEEVKASVQESFKRALGDDISLEESTPQGRLIEAITLSRIETLRTCALLANMFNPNLAYGSFLDSICALTGCERRGASRSSVIATCSGDAGTLIPAGSLVKTKNNDEFYSENDATIGTDGTVDVIFLSSETGAIPCGTGELTQIVTDVLGWTGITNANAAIVGTDREGDTPLKVRRLETLYSGRGFIGDIQARLANIANVRSYVILQNNRNIESMNSGLLLQPHSVYVCVYGGADADIAKALYETVPAGCDYTGDVTVAVTDPYNGHEYNVAFNRPTVKQIDVKIYLKKDSGTGDVTGAVKKAVVDYQNGTVANIDGLQIGQAVSPFEIASAINIEVPGVFVNQVQIAFHGNALNTASLSIGMNEIAQISESNITIRYIS